MVFLCVFKSPDSFATLRWFFRVVSTGQTHRHWLTNIPNFACQAYFCVWTPRQTLLDKHILLVNSKTFLLVTSKKCLSSTCLCDAQTDKDCAWQGKIQMFAKQCLCVRLGLKTFSTFPDPFEPWAQPMNCVKNELNTAELEWCFTVYGFNLGLISTWAGR